VCLCVCVFVCLCVRVCVVNSHPCTIAHGVSNSLLVCVCVCLRVAVIAYTRTAFIMYSLLNTISLFKSHIQMPFIRDSLLVLYALYVCGAHGATSPRRVLIIAIGEKSIYISARLRACSCASHPVCVHAHTLTHTHTHSHAHTLTRTHTHAHTHTRTHTHIHKHTQVQHTCTTHTHILKHTHATHAAPCSQCMGLVYRCHSSHCKNVLYTHMQLLFVTRTRHTHTTHTLTNS